MILVLIDFDGVIIDSKKQSLEIFKKCLQKFHNCNNYKLINNLYNKADGFGLLSISKFLGNFLIVTIWYIINFSLLNGEKFIK
jgi:phosphoglycolate phosphatase-like HAD superfamily hydrolase